MRSALERSGAIQVVSHLCAFDVAWVKPTRLAGGCPLLGALARQCPGHAAHVRLEGKVYVSDKTSAFRTSFAAHYPPAFAASLADVLLDAAGVKAKRQCDDPRRLAYWEEGLTAGARLPKPERLLAAEGAAWQAILGWDGAVGQWRGMSIEHELNVLNDIKKVKPRRSGKDPPRRAATPAARRRGPRQSYEGWRSNPPRCATKPRMPRSRSGVARSGAL